MNETKLIIIMIAFIFVGVMFFAAGMYFSSKTYLQALMDAHETEEDKRHAVISGKLCGTIALALGGLTVTSGIAIRFFPKVFHYMALIYVIALIACFAALTFSFNKKNS